MPELFNHMLVLQPFLNGAKTAGRAEIEHFLAGRSLKQVGEPVFWPVAPTFNKRIAQNNNARLVCILGALLVAHAKGIGSVLGRKAGLFVQICGWRVVPYAKMLVAERPELAVNVHQAVRRHLNVCVYILDVEIGCHLKHGYQHEQKNQESF